jgi:hypothetical protein
MTSYKAFDQEVEINGRTVLTVVKEAMGRFSESYRERALQDVRVLAIAGSSQLGTALETYESRRRPAARRVRREARFEACVTMLRSPRLRWIRNRLVEYTPAFEWFISRQITDSQQQSTP